MATDGCGNVIEVDFESHRLGRLSAHEAFEESHRRLAEIQEQQKDLRRDALLYMASLEAQLRAERRRCRMLSRDLARERATNFPFTDDEVLAGFRTVYAGEPVAATSVAELLYRHAPTQSARVRVGLALSRLSRAGHVQAVVPAKRDLPRRWLARKGGNGA